MIPSIKLGNGNWAYKEGALLAYNDKNQNYKPIPLTFTGTGNGRTRVNQQGLIELVRPNVPRIDYADSDKGAVKLEKDSINVYLDSEPTSGGVNVTFEPFTWSNGFTNCVRFVDNTIDRNYQNTTVVAGQQYTHSIYVIMDDLSEPLPSSSITSGDFTLYIGASPTGTYVKEQIAGTNIWRVSFTGIASVTGSSFVRKATGQSTKGFRVVGLQMELGDISTSYIKSLNGVNGVRGVENFINTQISNYINPEAGFIYINYKLKTSEDGILTLNNTFNNRIEIVKNLDANTLTFNVISLSSTSFSTTQNVLPNQYNKVAFCYQDDLYRVFINGVKVAESIVASKPTPTIITDLRSTRFDNTKPINSEIKELDIYNGTPTDSFVTELTTV